LLGGIGQKDLNGPVFEWKKLSSEMLLPALPIISCSTKSNNILFM